MLSFGAGGDRELRAGCLRGYEGECGAELNTRLAASMDSAISLTQHGRSGRAASAGPEWKHVYNHIRLTRPSDRQSSRPVSFVRSFADRLCLAGGLAEGVPLK